MSQNTDSKPTTALNVVAAVADALAAQAPELFDAVVQVQVKRERDRRVDILDKAVTKRHQLFIEVQKLKPKKMVVMNDDGTTTEVPAPQTVDEVKAFQKSVKEAQEKLAQFDENFAKALKGDAAAFDKLAKAAG